MKRKAVDAVRVRRGLDRIGALVKNDPTLADRTAAMLAGRLDCPGLEDGMTAKRHVPMRLDVDTVARADALVPLLAAVPSLAAVGQVTRAAVLRMALAEGLAVLEGRYAPVKPKGRR